MGELPSVCIGIIFEPMRGRGVGGEGGGGVFIYPICWGSGSVCVFIINMYQHLTSFLLSSTTTLCLN